MFWRGHNPPVVDGVTCGVFAGAFSTPITNKGVNFFNHKIKI
jgi:hypothetical protein